MIARDGVGLLVAAFVLFVHDDESEVCERRENRGPHPDDDAVFPGQRQPPGIIALADRHAAVHDGDVSAERLSYNFV